MSDLEKAYWIWYPGEFEFMLGLDLHSQRYERGGQQTPIWKMEPMFPNAKFYKTFSIPEKTTLFIHGQGEVNVSLISHDSGEDNQWGVYDQNFRNGVTLEKGEYTMFVSVCNLNGLPTIYINNEYLKTGPGWEVDSTGYPKVTADYWFFDSVDNPPSNNFMKEEKLFPVAKERTSFGWLYDFGKEMMARPILKGIKGNTKEAGQSAAKRDRLVATDNFISYHSKAHAGNVGNIRLIYGESKEEALDVFECDIWDFPGIDVDQYEADSPRAFRYIHVIGGDELDVDKMYAMYVYLPIENKARFNCSEDKLNKIYDVSLYTLHLNCREFMLDGIKRDRWVWSGDATQSYLLNYYTFFDNPLCKRTMRMLGGKEPTLTHLNTITDYTFYWFISLYDYYLYTGDIDFLKQSYRRAIELMNFCEGRRDDRGFIISPPGEWVFVDWAPIDNSGDVSFIQMLYARALEILSKISALLGYKEDSEKYCADFEKTYAAFENTFWSEDKGCFTHGPATKDAVVTRYTNMFAIFFGYVDDARRRSITQNVLLNDDILAITTPYMKFYELMALCEIGELDTVISYIRSYWGGMIDLGATTIWEAYDPSMEGIQHYEMYDRKYGKSLCHAWGAGPTLLFGKYYLGVRPTKPGYTEFEISPSLAGLDYIDGSVPTPTGNIDVKLEKSNATIVNHSSGNGIIRINGIEKRISKGETVKIEL